MLETRLLGNSGLAVADIGLGCMGLNSVYGGARDRAKMIALTFGADDYRNGLPRFQKDVMRRNEASAARLAVLA